MTSQALNAFHNFGVKNTPGYKKAKAMAESLRQGGRLEQTYAEVASLKVIVRTSGDIDEVAKAEKRLAEIYTQDKQIKEISEDTQLERNVEATLL